MLRAPGSPPFEPVDIPIGSHVYVQLPGTRVLTGILHIEENYIGSVFVRKHDGISLTTDLVSFHHNRIHINYAYRCYILLPDGTVLTAFLHPYNPAQDVLQSMSIFIRVPSNILMVGILRRGQGHRPEWLPLT